MDNENKEPAEPEAKEPESESDHETDIETIVCDLGEYCAVSAQGSLITAPPISVPDAKGVFRKLRYPLTTAACKDLWSRGAQSPFGMRDITVTDTKVRDSREWPAGSLKFAKGSDQWVDYLEENWRTPIEQKLQCKIASIQPQKLVIYGPGGKFARHKDTLHAANHIATVVVTLPGPRYKGGKFKLYAKTGQVSVGCQGAQERLQHAPWIAFMTDVDHELTEVRAGYRVVVTYDIYGGTLLTIPDDRTLGLLGDLRVAIQDRFVQSKGKTLLLLTEHLYCDRTMGEEFLRGSDFLIYNHLTGPGKMTVILTEIELAHGCYPGDKDMMTVSGDGFSVEFPHDESYYDSDDQEDDEDHANRKRILNEGNLCKNAKTIVSQRGAELTGNNAAPSEYLYKRTGFVIFPPKK